jgi:NodT family efflux transporter outer membrane factor (OMF) lipoprotein
MLTETARKLFRDMRVLRNRTTGTCVALFLGGCTLLDPHVPEPEIEIPNAYLYKAAKEWRSAASPYDFAVFKSKQLTDLIALGRGFNLTLAAAIARIQEAEAQVRIAPQPLIPTVEAAGSGSQSLVHQQGQALRTTSVIAQLTASYTLDFWGQYRSLLFAAKATEWYQSFAAATVAISTDASIANTYFEVIGTQKQIQIEKNNLAAAERILQAIRDRFAAGTASGLDVAQQETLVANIRVTIPPLERQLEQFKHALAVLVGSAPEFFRFKGQELFSVAVPAIPAGLPSDLLCRRPDIASAEAQLAAQKFDVSSARAQMFPTIQLTGAGGFQSVALASLFQPQNAAYNAAVSITQPLTNLYGLQANLDFNKALYGELLADYRQAIIAAFQDVEDQLIAYQKDAETERLQLQAVTSARNAFRLSEAQLRGGIIDVTTLLQVEQTLFAAEIAYAFDRQARLQAAVSLYQALGGGWYKPPNSGFADVASVIEVKAKTP